MQQSRVPRRSGRKVAGPHPVDIHVGSRVRLRRNMLGLSQERLADTLGLTFQQVQKYEHGANRVGASRLLEIARILDVPVAFFYDDTDPVRAPAIAGFAEGASEPDVSDPLQAEETIELVMAYYGIRNAKARTALFELARAPQAPAEGAGRPRGRRGPNRVNRANKKEALSLERQSDILSGADG